MLSWGLCAFPGPLREPTLPCSRLRANFSPLSIRDSSHAAFRRKDFVSGPRTFQRCHSSVAVVLLPCWEQARQQRSPPCAVGVMRERCWEPQVPGFSHATHRILICKRQDSTVFSSLNDKQVFQRLISRSSVTERGWLLSNNSHCVPRECMVFV